MDKIEKYIDELYSYHSYIIQFVNIFCKRLQTLL